MCYVCLLWGIKELEENIAHKNIRDETTTATTPTMSERTIEMMSPARYAAIINTKVDAAVNLMIT